MVTFSAFLRYILLRDIVFNRVSVEMRSSKSAISTTRSRNGYRVIVGQDRFIDQALICLFSGGHTLIGGTLDSAKTLPYER